MVEEDKEILLDDSEPSGEEMEEFPFTVMSELRVQ
jgi:hypothetical protein